MKNYLIILRTLFAGLLICILNLTTVAQPPSHDPSTMIRNTDGRYWIFTTGYGIWCMSSSNSGFSDWQAENLPFANGWPGWISNYVSGFTGTFWAPDVIKIGSTYFLYYSCAGTGAAAAIGLATASDLNGPWTDQGMVVAGNNAIDPALYLDNGRLWMAWGNWQSGIDIVELSTSTGKPISNTTHLVSGEVEGPGLIRNGDYYYLFYQRGLCCSGLNSTYYMVVARSTSITGPYTDERVFLPNRSGNEHGPGHFGYGEGKLTYHYYAVNDNGNAKLAITTLGWSNGWPVAGGTGGWAAQSTIASPANGTYRITPYHSGKAVEVAGNSTASGANVQQWSYNGIDAQQWVLTNTGNSWYQIAPSNATGKSIDIVDISTAAGANANLWDYWGGDGQRWQFRDAGNGAYNIIARHSGQCLDVTDLSTADGANIAQYPCVDGFTNQMFTLEPIVTAPTFSGTYAIIASHSGKALDVYAWGTSNGTNICQWDYWGGATQQYVVTPVDGEWHSIVPVIATEKALDINGCTTDAGANVQIWDYWGGSCQQFRFQSSGSGVYRIISRNGELCLDIANASTDNGANLQMWNCTSGSAWQMFSMQKLSGKKQTSVNEETQKLPLVYPNPATSSITVELPGSLTNAELRIYDQSGRLVMSELLTQMASELSVGSLDPGFYMVKVLGDNINFSNILVKH